MCLWLFMIILILLDFTLCISVSLCGDMWLHNYSYCTLCLRFHFRWIVWWCLLQWFLSPIFSFPALKSELSTRSKLMLPVFPTEAPIPPAIAISILKSWDLMYWPLLTHLKHLKTCSNESQSSAALPKGLVGRCHLDAARYQAPVVAILGDWQSTFKFQVIFAPLQIHILLLQSECVSTIYNQCGILA